MPGGIPWWEGGGGSVKCPQVFLGGGMMLYDLDTGLDLMF